MSRDQTNPISLTAIHPIPQGISLPKLGTLIPNRIFVGGISSNTTEEELRTFFSVFGAIKDVKIIYDKSGLSKGSYGFVTFEDQQTVESVIKNESESLIFKDRKLNIGYAVRKQHIFQKHELGSALLLAHNPCSLANGLSLVQLCPHDHSVIAMNHQPAIYYPATVMIPSNAINHHFCAPTSWAANNNTSNIATWSINNSFPNGQPPVGPTPVATHQINAHSSTAFLVPRNNQPWSQETADCERTMPKLNMPFTPTTTGAFQTYPVSIRSHPPTQYKTPSAHGEPYQWFASMPRSPNNCHSLVRHPHGSGQNVPAEYIRIGSTMPFNTPAAESQTPATASYSTPTAQFPGAFEVGYNSARRPVQSLPDNLKNSFQFLTASCGTQCLHHTETCPATHVAKTGNTSDVDKIVDAPSVHDPRSCPAYLSASTDGSTNLLIRRILQSHVYDNTQTTVAEFPGTNKPGEGEWTPEPSVSQPTRSCVHLDSTVPPESTKKLSPEPIPPYYFARCRNLLSSDSQGYDHSVQLDNMLNEDTNFKSYPLSGKANYCQPTSDRVAEPHSSHCWFEPPRTTDPFAPKRLFGMDLLSNETNEFDLPDRAECKISDALISTGNNTTTACGDISKQRQD